MNGTLKVEPAKLKAAAGQFQSTSTTIKNATNGMTQAVSSLTGTVWSGDAASKYIQQFNGLQDEIQKIDRMIQEHVQDLNDMAAQYETAENAATQQASSLQTQIF